MTPTPVNDAPSAWSALDDVPLDGVLARMHAAVQDDGPAAVLYAWLRDHLGWIDAGSDAGSDGGIGAHGAQVLVRTAKGIRPRVALATAAAVGGRADAAAAIDVAAAIELTHEFSLIHDDVEDGDRVRRGRPTLWTQIGVPQAVNAGDALFGIARSVLMNAPIEAGALVAMARRYDRACIRLAEGQCLDLAFESADVRRVTPADYTFMTRAKTGALIGAAAALGALGGGGDAAVADALAAWGELVGVAFQIQDDVLGLWGDPALTLKPVGHDLLRRKKGLPILLGMADPRTSERIIDAFAREAIDPATAAEIAAVLWDTGVAEACKAAANAHAATAEALLDGLALREGPRAALASLGRAAVDRRR